MKFKIIPFISCLSIFSCVCLFPRQACAADFSKAQHIYAPPTLVDYGPSGFGANYSGPNATGLPTGLNIDPNAMGNIPTSSNAPYIDALINGGGSSGASAAAGGASSGVNWSGVQSALSNYQYVPGLSTQVNKISSQVNNLMSNGKYAEAESVARQGLKYFPTSSILKGKFATITSTEAQALLAAQNYDLAGTKAREALVANPNNQVAKSVEGKVLQAQGLNPNSADDHVKAGDTMTAAGRQLEASVEYKLALGIKPNVGAHVGLGNLDMSKNNVVGASQHFDKALTLDPQSGLAYRQRGALHYLMKDQIGANSDFSKAVSLAPNDPLAANALTGLWKQQVAENPNSANSHLGLARAYLQTNNLEGARSEYKNVVALDPNNPALPAARQSFRMALVRQQANQSFDAAKTLDAQGATNEAHQKLMEALACSPNDPQILLYHGQVCEKMGLPQQAHDAYMSVLKVDPKNAEAARHLKAMSGQTGLQADQGTFASTPFSSLSPPARIDRPNQVPSFAPEQAATANPINGQTPTGSPPQFSNPWQTGNFTVPNNLPPTNMPFTPFTGGNPALTIPSNNDIYNAPLKSPLLPKSQIEPKAQLRVTLSVQRPQGSVGPSNPESLAEAFHIIDSASTQPTAVVYGNIYSDRRGRHFANNLYAKANNQFASNAGTYISNGSQIDALSNFACSVRGLIIAEKQALRSPKKSYAQGYAAGIKDQNSMSNARYLSSFGSPQ